MNTFKYTIDEARMIGDRLGVDWEKFDSWEFMKGLNAEKDPNEFKGSEVLVVNQDLALGKVVLNRLKNRPDYYSSPKEVEEGKLITHYYGDRVRRIFLAIAVVLLVGLPFVQEKLTIPVMAAIVMVLVLDYLAALMTPKQKWVSWANALVSTVALVVFEYLAVKAYANHNTVYFVTNQFLALMFLFAIYLNTKTLRAMLLR
jgi:hypothetical protein